MAKLYVFPFKAKRISVMALTMRLVTVKEKRLFMCNLILLRSIHSLVTDASSMVSFDMN